MAALYEVPEACLCHTEAKVPLLDGDKRGASPPAMEGGNIVTTGNLIPNTGGEQDAVWTAEGLDARGKGEVPVPLDEGGGDAATGKL